MKIGFIGTGYIAKSVITGILGSKLKINKIFISQRNKKISNFLSRKSRKIVIINNNQEIINRSNWVFLSVTPKVGNNILKCLNFKSNQTIVSFISTIKMSQLKKYIKVKATIVRAIPLPPISLRKGPVPIFPPNKNVKRFFNQLGTTVEIGNEKFSTQEFIDFVRRRTNNEENLDNNLIEKLYKNYSIKCAVQYYPLYKYPLFKKMGFGKSECLNTEKFFDNMISFPFHIWMKNKQFDYMISSVKKVLINLRKSR